MVNIDPKDKIADQETETNENAGSQESEEGGEGPE